MEPNVKIIPFCVPLPSASSLVGDDANVDSGIVGTITLRGQSAVIWFGYGSIEEGKGSSIVNEGEDGLVSVGNGM